MKIIMFITFVLSFNAFSQDAKEIMDRDIWESFSENISDFNSKEFSRFTMSPKSKWECLETFNTYPEATPVFVVAGTKSIKLYDSAETYTNNGESYQSSEVSKSSVKRNSSGEVLILSDYSSMLRCLEVE